MKFYMEAIISDSSLLIPLLENGGEGFKNGVTRLKSWRNYD